MLILIGHWDVIIFKYQVSVHQYQRHIPSGNQTWQWKKSPSGGFYKKITRKSTSTFVLYHKTYGLWQILSGNQKWRGGKWIIEISDFPS